MTAERFTGTLVGDQGSRLVVRDAELAASSPAPAPAPSPAPPIPPAPMGTRRSGLAWSSGVFANDKTMPARFATMRGRPVDLADVHCASSDIANPYWLRDYTPASVGSLTLSCPLSAGTPMSAWVAAGRAMAGRGFKGPLARLRPGVEFNLANESQVSDSTAEAWIARFRVAANAFRQGAGPGSLVCLCVNEGNGSGKVSPATLQDICDVLLRDGSADELGVDFYDQWPPMPTADAFAARVTASRFGSLGYWADFASARGRRVSVPEWGVARTDGGQWAGHAGGDNPVFVTSMVGWFRVNAARLGYEAYFAEPADYIRSDLTTQMPQARAAYVAALA